MDWEREDYLTSFLIEVYHFTNFMTVEKAKREVIYKAIDSYQEVLRKVAYGYGHCDECGWEISSSEITREIGLSKISISKSSFAEVCEGFDESGEPIDGTNCLLVEHLRYTGEINSD
ncbi:hypothetical protein IID21_02080 [Patescibacteria group bacterium]|nr:hypothetical protein [Patescibacteria group bacterium]